jgi:hypothetical protein
VPSADVMVSSVTAALSMPAGAISGVAVVTSGLNAGVGSGAACAGGAGVFENSATGTVSTGPPGVLDLPQLHGAYHDP